MPSKTVLCEYCNKRINKNPAHRKSHRQSKAHLENVSAYFNSQPTSRSIGIGPWERVYTPEEMLYYSTISQILRNDLYKFQAIGRIQDWISKEDDLDNGDKREGIE